ncbi:MAG: hypothetical protein ROW48_14215 [Bellilinea sp.]|jgi:hypothetical protein
MNETQSEAIQQLKRIVIIQKSTHLLAPEHSPLLERLYDLIRQYDEHLSNAIFSTFRGAGSYSPFPRRDELQLALQEVLESQESDVQRESGTYLRYKERLDEINALIRQILEPHFPKEADNVT